jgi:hypothetical protein
MIRPGTRLDRMTALPSRPEPGTTTQQTERS